MKSEPQARFLSILIDTDTPVEHMLNTIPPSGLHNGIFIRKSPTLSDQLQILVQSRTPPWSNEIVQRTKAKIILWPFMMRVLTQINGFYC